MCTCNNYNFYYFLSVETKPVVHSGTPSYSQSHYGMYDSTTCSTSSNTGTGTRLYPQCKACCFMDAHFDDKFGFFYYCSPKCRDEDFLPKYNKKLAEDIDNYHTLSTSITLPYQSSSKTASSRLTTSPKDRSISTRTVNVELTPKESLGLVLVNDGPRIVSLEIRDFDKLSHWANKIWDFFWW